MALQTQQLERTFRYNSVDLIDPGAQFTPEQVRDFYAPTYPEILNAAIEGPEEKDGKLAYTFRRAVGTKGALNVRFHTTALSKDHASVPQLLELAGRDSDPVSIFVNGSDWSDAQGAILVVKGRKLARELVELLERQGLVTPGKSVAEAHELKERDLTGITSDEAVLLIELHPQAHAGVYMVANERKRQVEKEGYTPEHDDEHTGHSLAMAAAAYAAPEPLHVYRSPPDQFSDPWPWHPTEDRRKFVDRALHVPASADDYTLTERIALLTKAGALVCAEIDRLARLQKAQAYAKA